LQALPSLRSDLIVSDMPPPQMTPENLFAHFDELCIADRTYSHPPVFTVAEAVALRRSLPGGAARASS